MVVVSQSTAALDLVQASWRTKEARGGRGGSRAGGSQRGPQTRCLLQAGSLHPGCAALRLPLYALPTSPFRTLSSHPQQKLCDARGWGTVRIDGGTDVSKRQDVVHSFNKYNVGQVGEGLCARQGRCAKSKGFSLRRIGQAALLHHSKAYPGCSPLQPCAFQSPHLCHHCPGLPALPQPAARGSVWVLAAVAAYRSPPSSLCNRSPPPLPPLPRYSCSPPPPVARG